MSGNTIVYTPRIHNGTVSWRCDFAGDIQRSYLPRKCAGVKTE
ncbi:pilin [Kingella potus]|nr:pilin [Kingella potus]UOP01354.1 pilin [Kingella potus]